MKSNPLFIALASKYEADKRQALATLDIYFHNSVGIGEHPQHLEEMDKIIQQLTDANDKLETLKQFFTRKGEIKNRASHDALLQALGIE